MALAAAAKVELDMILCCVLHVAVFLEQVRICVSVEIWFEWIFLLKCQKN